MEESKSRQKKDEDGDKIYDRQWRKGRLNHDNSDNKHVEKKSTVKRISGRQTQKRR